MFKGENHTHLSQSKSLFAFAVIYLVDVYLSSVRWFKKANNQPQQKQKQRCVEKYLDIV